MIERPLYLDRLRRLRGTSLAKVLTGMRRAGKSGILRLLEQQLLEEGVVADAILVLDLELMQNERLRDAEALLAHVRERASRAGTTYVMLDEAQQARGIGRVAYALMEEGRYDLYLTGSHARLVERELYDALAGRYVEIPVFPLSFAEYHAAHAVGTAAASPPELFERYLQNGGLPQALLFERDPYALREYLDGVYNTVVRRDVSCGLGKEDPALLDAITRHLMTHVGMPISANGVSRALTSGGSSCSDDTVSLYLRALVEAHAFHRVRRLDLKTGMRLKTQERYYADDLGIRSVLLGAGRPSLQGLLENVIYLELRRRYREVDVGRHYTRHISFVARSGEGREYYQVAPSVLDPALLERSLAPLRAERDHYPKTLLTLDAVGTGSHDGIRHLNAIDWLLA